MAIDRRTFLGGAAALTGGGHWGPREVKARENVAAAGMSTPLFAAARRSADGRHSVAILDAAHRELQAAPLPVRGHDATFCPVSRRCVMFSRRPGTYATVVSLDVRHPSLEIVSPAGRHFYGHGVFSRDGRLLYATENDFEARRGVIGIYDATDGFRRTGQLPSHGIGPHDIALLPGRPDGRTELIVANGGLLEHPGVGGGRQPLNSGSFVTSIAHIDAATGDLIERHELPEGQPLSLRHIDLAKSGELVIGAQVHTSAGPAEPLVFRKRRGSKVEAVELADSVTEALAGYVSSVAISDDGATCAVTSSRRGVIVIAELATGRVLRLDRIADVSGIAAGATPHAFVATSGYGDVRTLALDGETPDRASVLRFNWDNHLARL